MDASLERSLDDVVEALRHSRDTHRRGCSLLIGAGCSATAGVASAAGFVRIIEERFKAAYGRAASKMSSGPPGFPQCMAELSPGQRRDLINEQLSGAKVNWAHVAIAQLIKFGYVNCVLTTNVDPLVLRACAMLGEFPAVYNFAISQPKPVEPDKAIFHLHGQSTGFVLMNTDQEVADHSIRLGPLFQDAGQGRPWIVVGYSGDNDPVFDHLAGIDRFDYHLFWVAFKDEVPARHVRDKLLRPGKDAYVVRGYDADRFFVELAQKLECFPPDFVRRPFSFLNGLLSNLTEYRLSGENEIEIDILQDLRGLIGRAIAQFEEATPQAEEDQAPRSREAVELAATALLIAGKHDELKRLAEMLGDKGSPAVSDAVAWSRIEQGNALSVQARTKSGEEADALFALAGEKYAAALALKPDMHEALYDWGNALSDQARTKSGEAADALFMAAGEKYAAALALKPDMHEALYNWGNALSDQARTKSGEAADALFTAAGERYAAALAIKPDDHEVLYNWGNALAAQAQTKSGEVADALFTVAGEKYAAAVTVAEYRLGRDHLLVGDILRELGTVYFKTNDFKEADNILKRSLAISRRHGGHSDVALTALVIGKIYDMHGKVSEAEQYYILALTNYETIGDEQKIDSVLYRLALLYYKNGEMINAMASIGKAIAVSRKRDGASPQGYLALIKKIRKGMQRDEFIRNMNEMLDQEIIEYIISEMPNEA